jgi:lycopene beta-cyclase
MVRGIDFYRSIRQRLEGAPSVHFKLGSVEEIAEDGQNALVTIAGEQVAAHWVFDSVLRPGDLTIDTVRYHSLKQHFKGWEIETDRDSFDPEVATLFDFRTPQKNDMRFLYVLPFSRRRALVEYTIFSADLLAPQEYETALKDYLGGVLGLSSYRVLSEENGMIPMTDQPFRRKASPHVLNIGTKGGLVKPSSGYAFARMQRDALAVAASLGRFGHPFAIPRSPGRYRLYDSILLQLMYRRGGLMKPIFTRLFKRNPIQRIFHFLDEDASLWQDAALIASLPPGPFLGALLKLAITRRA